MAPIRDILKGISCVLAGFLLQFSLGTIYTFGNMSPYIASYLKYRTNNTWVTNGQLVWVFSIAVFSQALTMSLGGLLEKKVGPRITCWIGSWTMSLGTALTYFTIQHNLWMVILTYGLIFGMGTGLTYSVAISTPMKWFPAHKGLVAGTVVAGYGLGSLAFNLIQTEFINPWNISPNATDTVEKYFTEPTVLDNIPYCFLLLGLMYSIIQLVGVILMTNPEYRQTAEDENKLLENSESEDKEVTPIDSIDLSVHDSVKQCRFWILWSTFFFNGVVIVTVSSLYKSFGQTFINDDRYFSIVGAVAAIFNSGGRLFWGKLFDVFYYKKMMTALTAFTVFVMGSFYFTSLITSTTGAQVMYFIWVCMLFFCVAGSFALFPPTTSQSFGSKNMAITYGLVFTGYAMSSILGALVSSMLLEIISYWGQFIVAMICAIISLILTQFFKQVES